MEKLLTILKLLPAIIVAIKAIEDAIPESGKGKEKLAAIRGIIEAVDSSATVLWPQIAATVGVLVNLFNATGVFKKPDAPATA